MISRRLLRIKALMALYAFNRREDENLAQAETELMFSIGKSYDLYHYLLLLVIELADIANEKIDQALMKRMPSHADLNPKRKFIDNRVITQLRKNIEFKNYISSKKLSWFNNSHIPRLLYNKMIVWEAYEEYMQADNDNYISSMVEKTLKKFKSDSGEKTQLMPLFKNAEDEEFVKVLFRKAIVHKDKC